MDIIDKAREWARQLGHYGAHAGGVVMEQCADEISRLRAELAAVRADAERYRWLRGGKPRTTGRPSAGLVEVMRWDDRSEGAILKGDALGAAIDAARGGQQ